jgi:phosphoglycolate phosphatase
MDEAKCGNIRALIFDLDGTLIDSKNDLIQSVNAMLRELGRGELAAETISGYIGDGAPKLVARALGEGCTEKERQSALEFFLKHYETHKLDTTRAYAGVPETLEEMRSWPMAVLTNKPVRISVRILEGLGLARYFKAIYGGNSFDTKKPDPWGARTIIREMRAVADQTMMVGDSDVDVKTARNAGTMAAVVNYGFGAHDKRTCPADIYLEHFRELTTLLRRN